MINSKYKVMKKIWFYCWECRKYNWIEATPYLLKYYDGVDSSYCPHCDDETQASVAIGKKPLGDILNLNISI